MRARDLAIPLALVALAPPPGFAGGFEEAAVRFEQNATDGDFEIVLEIKSGATGVDRLTVQAPDGRTVFELACPEPARLGLRQFALESPEPPDLAAVKEAFPEGTYVVRGRTVDGGALESEAVLTHELPAAAGFVVPAEDAEDVVVEGLVIRWHSPAGIERIEVEIEDEETGAAVVAVLPARITSFSPPEGFLEEGAEYTLALGTVAGSGNKTFVETSFTTAE